MTAVYEQLRADARSPVLCVADHASNQVPEDIELGIPPGAMTSHIAWDIGVDGMARTIAHRGVPTHISTVSRLVCDMHRRPADPAAVPTVSDGIAIPGNVGADHAERIARFHTPYHGALAALIDEVQPRLIVALHSFTPQLADMPEPRPWDVGLLYNRDDRAARIAIDLFAAEGLTVGDNQPYSGKRLNATMDRHAEGRGIPYLTIEVRQDLVADTHGQGEWAARILDVAREVERRCA